MIDKNSSFYINAKKMLDEYVSAGGNVNDLGNKDKVYVYIKNKKLKDEQGNSIDMETKFKLLGHPRARVVSKDVRQDLIDEVDKYKKAGGSFHIARKKLPFYPELNSYSRRLRNQGVELSHEQIMKGLGYKDFSDIYFRCLGIFELKNYRNENGFVDSYRKNQKLKAYIIALSEVLNLPNYLVVTLVADEKLEKCHISTEYINHVKTELQQYVKENGSLKGIRRKNKKLYYKFNTLMKYYSDGSEISLTAEDWLNIFGLDNVENRFKKSVSKPIDITPIMDELKQKFGNNVISAKNLDAKSYSEILKKAVKLGIPPKELFRNYGLNYQGNTVNRLSEIQVTKIPYLEEMRDFRDNLLKAQGFTSENGYCKEEIFEAKVAACKQAYDKFKDKMFNFEIDETENLEDVTNF